jgi:hypothetical protein
MPLFAIVAIPRWDFAQEAGQHGYVTAAGQIARNLPDIIMDSLCKPIMQLAAREFSGHPEAAQLSMQVMAKVLEYRHWIPLAAQYELCGRQIFDLTDDLAEMLSQTDIGDCTLEDWHAPYDAFYCALWQARRDESAV